MGSEVNGLALSRFSVIYATPPCVITPRSPVQGSRAVPEHLCLTRPYVPKARTLGDGRGAAADVDDLTDVVGDRRGVVPLPIGTADTEIGPVTATAYVQGPGLLQGPGREHE